MSRDRYASAKGGWSGRLDGAIANARWIRRLRRWVTTRWPLPDLLSDVREIVYANWIVPAADLAPMTPAGVALEERDGKALLTVLTYRHGHFGPAMAGSLRRLFPSPLQSNWRAYASALDGKPLDVPTVLFIANIFDSRPHAIAARVMSDALPAHAASCFSHHLDEKGGMTIIAPGGSAPSMTMRVEAAAAPLPDEFTCFFADWTEAVARITLQDAALVALPDEPAIARAAISLPIDVTTIKQLRAASFVPGELLTSMGASAPPFCFAVPSVQFRVRGEAIVRRC